MPAGTTGTLDVRCGDAVVRVDAGLATCARPRVNLSAFTQAPAAEPALVVARAALPHGRVAEGPMGRCRYVLSGRSLEVDVEDEVFAVELVLRLAWHVVTTRAGGCLMHAAAIAVGDRALVAAGQSGDGKSTLSRLCRGAGLELLTDEIVQLFPDGRCGGTPFRSDEDNVGAPGLRQAAYFVALQKAPHEALAALAPLEAMRLASAQCFDVETESLPRAEQGRRLLRFLGATTLRTLAFRKDPAVGDFVRSVLGAPGQG